MSRYAHLLELIDEHKPQSLVEIGVWNGANAIRMIKQALKHHDIVTYTGYDLFEEATAETDSKEFNVKGHNSVRAVAAYIRAETGIEPNLVKGDTNETLNEHIQADFVFLDGGHSVETIKHDFTYVSACKLIVMDDYYTDGVDITKYGCNFKVLKEKEWDGLFVSTSAAHRTATILPTKDPVRGGGFAQLVVVM